MAADMGLTNKQFQGFIRLALGWLEKALVQYFFDNHILYSSIF